MKQYDREARFIEREAALSEPKPKAKPQDHRTQAHRDVLRMVVAAHQGNSLQVTLPTALLLALLDEHDAAIRRAAILQAEIQPSFLEAA